MIVPSPQLIVAVKSLATLTVSVSVKVAIVVVKGWFAVSASVVPVPAKWSFSVTATEPDTVMLELSEIRVMVTLADSLPSSA